MRAGRRLCGASRADLLSIITRHITMSVNWFVKGKFARQNPKTARLSPSVPSVNNSETSRPSLCFQGSSVASRRMSYAFSTICLVNLCPFSWTTDVTTASLLGTFLNHSLCEL